MRELKIQMRLSWGDFVSVDSGQLMLCGDFVSNFLPTLPLYAWLRVSDTLFEGARREEVRLTRFGNVGDNQSLMRIQRKPVVGQIAMYPALHDALLAAFGPWTLNETKELWVIVTL